MKHRYTALTGIVLGAALLLSAIGCTGAPAGSGNATSAQETQPAAPEPDTRQLTDTTAYKARLSNSFEGIEPATAAELTFTADADGVTITGYTGGATVLVIPAELDGKPVVAVGEGAFRGATVRALSLPDSLRRIGFGALEKCRELVTLRTPLLCADGKDWFASLFGADSYMSSATAVPAKLTTLILTGGADLRTVPDYCFYGCTGLETVGLPAGVETVGAFAFYGAGSLAYVSLPDSLRRVGEYAFANCQTLLSLCLSAGTESLGAHMLEGCARLEKLALPFVGGTADAPETAYLGYLFGAASHTLTEGFLPASLQSVELLPGCTAVPDNAFYECSRLREIILPDTVTSVGYRAFYRCAYLTAVTLPAGLTALGDEAFSGCVRLETADLSMLDTTDGWGIQTFRGCISLRSVTLSDSLSGRLPSGTFAGCTALEELTAGYHTEYSGMHFGLFYVAEFVNLFIVAGVAATIFLGGWMPLHIAGWEGFNAVMDCIPGFVWFFAKAFFVVWLLMWIKWTFPRLRIDQILTLEWKYLVPIGLANLLLMVIVVVFKLHF